MQTKKIINLWEHNSWGNNVYFSDWEDRKLVGWLLFRPHVGDEVRSKMSSGKIARFEITEVDSVFGVDDMFFAKVKDLDYLDENN